MTKSREKLLNRAKKAGLSESKVAFLSREDLNMPEYFFTDSYWFVKKFSDEELEKKGYDLLVEMFRLSSSSCFKDTVDNALHYTSIEELESVVNMHKNNSYPIALFRLLKLHQITNFCMDDTIYLVEKASVEPDSLVYLYFCNFSLYVPNKNEIVYPYISADERHLYAKEGVKQLEEQQQLHPNENSYFLEIQVRHQLEPFVIRQVSFAKAKKYNFDFQNYKQCMREKCFSCLNQALKTADKISNSVEFDFVQDDADVFTQAQAFVKNAPLPVTMHFPCSIVNTRVIIGSDAVMVKIAFCDTVIAQKKSNGETGAWIKYRNSSNWNHEFVIFHTDRVTGLYQKMKRDGRLIPMNLKSLFYILEKVRVPLLQDLVNQGYTVFKDLILHPVKSNMAIPPVPLNEFMNKHNLNEVFNRYKNGRYFNWNKGNYQQYYTIMKAMALVSEEDKRKIVACKDRLHEFNPANFLFEEAFLCEYIQHNIEKNGTVLSDSEIIQIRDYIKMCRENKKKIKISFRSIKTLVREHNIEISLLDTGRNTLKVPKNSKFKPLRKLLPKEFVWIKNKKRLILEGREQGHCVASYADYITKDYCAIYSVVYEGIRYTIEICLDKNGSYYINQCQSKFAYIGHKDFDDSVLDYINEYLY